jgi:hypothetical protein
MQQVVKNNLIPVGEDTQIVSLQGLLHTLENTTHRS